MIRRFWNFISSVQLTFVLLLLSVIFFIIGAWYTNEHYAFFSKMNEMRIQDWFLEFGLVKKSITWWLPFLIFTLFLLGVNTLACSIKRVAILLPSRKLLPLNMFIYSLAPSIIHILFLMVMTGHGVTSILGTWERITIEKNRYINIGDGERFEVKNVIYEYYPDNTSLNNRICQTNVILQNNLNRNFSISYLNHYPYGPYHLHLDMIKTRKKDNITPIIYMNKSENTENCNKAHIFHNATTSPDKKLLLLIVYDPGLYVIISGFILILIIMIWYFLQQKLNISK